MGLDAVADILRDMIFTTLIVSAPIMVASLGIGLVISVLQAATQVNEQTLTFIPKIVGVFTLFGMLFPWSMTTVIDFAHRLMEIISQQGGP